MQSLPPENKPLKKASSNLQDFLNLDALQSEIEITGTESASLLGRTLYKIEMRYCTKVIFQCSRRYNDFYALHKVLKIRFGLIDWPKFPSKSDLFNKIENRKLGFTSLLQTMLRSTVQHKSIKENILKLLFNFLTKDLSGKEQPKSQEQLPGIIIERQQSKQNEEEDDDPTQLMKQLDCDVNESFLNTCNQCQIQNKLTASGSNEIPQNTSFISDISSISRIELDDQTDVRKRTPHLSVVKNSSFWEEPDSNKKAGFDQNGRYDYLKEIENYGEYIKQRLLRFSEDEIYKQFYAKIDKSNLLLFSQVNVQQDSFSCQICLHQATIKKFPDKIVKQILKRFIKEIYHELDFKKMQITVEGEVPSRRAENNLLRTFDHKLKVLHQQLKFATQKPPLTLPEYLNEDFNPVGKIQLHIKEARNLTNLPQNSLIQCRIKFSPFVYKTKVHMRSENPQWRQDFIMQLIHFEKKYKSPVNDSYGAIILEIVLLINDGVFSKHQKESVIGYAELQMADILSYHSDTRSKLLNVLLINNSDVQSQKHGVLSKLQKSFTGSEQDTEKKPFISISIRNLSSIYSIFASPPIQTFEGEKQEPDFNLFKLSIVRFKRISGLIGLFAVYMDDIMDQKYPKLTKLFFTTIFIFALFADMNNLLYYISVVFIVILTYHSPYIKPIITKILDQQIFDEINPTYLKPKILTEEEYELSMKCQSLDKVIKFEGNNLKFEDNEDDEKDQESLLQKLRVMKKQFFVLQVQLTWISNGFEKFLNLFTWQEPSRTLYVFTLFLIMCFVIRILPIRFLIMAGCNHDQSIILKQQMNGLTDNKFITNDTSIIMSQAKLLWNISSKNFLQVKNKNLIQPQEYTKTIQYLEQEWPSNPQSKAKILEEIRLHLQLHITQEEFNSYKTPIALIEYFKINKQNIRAIKTCQQRLKLNRIIDNTFERDQLYYELRQSCKKRLKPHILLFYTISNFFYNIPSDYYRIKCPKKEYYQ